MLFILALQHQMLQNNKKENNQYQTQLIKEAIQHQSYLLRESLLKEAKRMKRQLRRQERLIDIENNFRYFYKDIAKLRIDMIKEATLDSENRANNIAETLNKQVTGLRHLHTGRFAIYAEDVSVTQDYASEWTEEKSKKKRIRIIVTGTYNLKS